MSKCWYCNNELTTGDNPKHFGICNKCYDKMFRSGDTIIRSLTNKISDLEAKLAEKDKEIERLNLEFETQEDWQEKWQKLYDETCNLTQDKISFAVEQLKKVKEKILSYEEIYYQFLESGAKVPVVCLENFRVKQTIDNQIKELKGEE